MIVMHHLRRSLQPRRRLFASAASFYGRPRESSRSTTENSSLLRNVRVAVDAATTAFADPTRADAVAALGEVTGYVALQNLLETMKQDETGQRILLDRPTVSKETLPIDDIIASASELPDRTFGQAYGAFLKGHGFDPDERSDVLYIQDPELAYIMLRYRQVRTSVGEPQVGEFVSHVVACSGHSAMTFGTS